MVLGIAVVFALVSMSVHDDDTGPAAPADPAVQRTADAWNARAIDSVVGLLRTGNVVLRMGVGADSRIVAQMNQHDKAYSHCGIVMVEGGYPFVYHSIGGEDNPDARLRRDSACSFFSPRHNTGIAVIGYDHTAATVITLRQVVTTLYRQRPRFDMKFDLATDDQLYCSEFVYKAITRAVHDTGYLHTTYVLGHTIVGIDDLYLNSHARMVCAVRYK